MRHEWEICPTSVAAAVAIAAVAIAALSPRFWRLYDRTATFATAHRRPGSATGGNPQNYGPLSRRLGQPPQGRVVDQPEPTPDQATGGPGRNRQGKRSPLHPAIGDTLSVCAPHGESTNQLAALGSRSSHATGAMGGIRVGFIGR